MPRVEVPIDPNELVELYATGVSLAHCAREFRTRSTRIRSELENLGVHVRTRSEQMRMSPPRQTFIPNIEHYAARYIAGEGINNLAIDADVAPGTMRKYLSRHGVAIRPQSTAAANAAARGSKRTPEQLRARAVANAQSLYAVGPQEVKFAELLRACDCEFVQQAAIGKYNVDFALEVPRIAVEIVTGGGNRRVNANRTERIKYVLDQGWHVVEVMLTKGVTPRIEAAEYLVSLGQLTSEQPSGPGHHWMIWGDGKGYRATGSQVHQVAAVHGSEPGVEAAA